MSSYFLNVNGREYQTYSERVIEHIKTPFWGSVDMSVKATVVFEVRDANGQVVCRDPKYRP